MLSLVCLLLSLACSRFGCLLRSWVLCGTDFALELKLAPAFVFSSVGFASLWLAVACFDLLWLALACFGLLWLALAC